MQVMLPKIHDTPSAFIGNVGVAYGPLLRHRLVKGLRAGGDFVNLQLRQQILDIPQRVPNAFAGEAARDGKQIAHPSVHLLADVKIICHVRSFPLRAPQP